MKSKYLFLDCEFGSLHRRGSLLTVYLAIVNKDFEIERELDLKLKPDDNFYVVEPEAMAVNKINLIELGKEAITYKEAKPKLFKFLQSAYTEFDSPNITSFGEEYKLVPVGHGIKGDIDRIQDHLISIGSWEGFCSYRVLDTSSSARFLQSCGKLPSELSCGLGNLGEYFGIKWQGEAHTASADTLMNIEVFKKLQKLV